MRRHLLGLLSFTWWIVDTWKQGMTREQTGVLLMAWNFSFLTTGVAVCILLGLSEAGYFQTPHLVYSAIFLIAFFRANEVILAFTTDAMDHLESRPQATVFSRTKRIQLIAMNYIHLIFCFGIMHDCSREFFSPEAYSPCLTGIFDALYFSATTITTTGYGDIAPHAVVPKLLCIYEPLAGIALFGFALAAYLGAERKTL